MNFFQWSYGIVFLWLVLGGIQNTEESKLNLFYATTKVLGPPCFYRALRVKKHVTLLSVHRFVHGLVLLQRSTLPFILILLANDVELNPGPVYAPKQPTQSRHEETTRQHRAPSSLNCLAINARSLKGFHSVNGQVSNLTLPMKKIKGKSSPPWITGHVLYMIRKKESLRKKLRSSSSTSPSSGNSGRQSKE